MNARGVVKKTEGLAQAGSPARGDRSSRGRGPDTVGRGWLKGPQTQHEHVNNGFALSAKRWGNALRRQSLRIVIRSLLRSPTLAPSNSIK